jgi:hypothetical protein
MISDAQYITILNENNCPVYTPSLTNPMGLKFDACKDGIPSELPITFSEFRYITKRTNAFAEGLLMVEPELEDEALKTVGIYKKSVNFLTNEEIEDIIINPTTEKLQRIINVTSIVAMDKIRIILCRLNNADEYDIAIRVYDVINARYSEVCKGKVTSNIKITKRKNETHKEIETGIVENESEKEIETGVVEKENISPKKPGRPPKKTE